jgi:predicted phage tail protein
MFETIKSISILLLISTATGYRTVRPNLIVSSMRSFLSSREMEKLIFNKEYFSDEEKNSLYQEFIRERKKLDDQSQKLEELHEMNKKLHEMKDELYQNDIKKVDELSQNYIEKVEQVSELKLEVNGLSQQIEQTVKKMATQNGRSVIEYVEEFVMPSSNNVEFVKILQSNKKDRSLKWENYLKMDDAGKQIYESILKSNPMWGNKHKAVADRISLIYKGASDANHATSHEIDALLKEGKSDTVEISSVFVNKDKFEIQSLNAIVSICSVLGIPVEFV